MYVIETAMAIEKLVKDGKINLKKTFTKITEWGLHIDVSMAQHRDDKPIVFTFAYRMDRQAFVKWINEHRYMLTGEILGFTNAGITVMIPGPGVDKYAKTNFLIVIKYTNSDEPDTEVSLDILNDTVEFLVHREVVSEHDWMITTSL